MTKNQVDINKLIEESYKVPESVFDRKRTKTSHFMLNTIFPGTSTLMGTEYFVNAFLDDKGFEHHLTRPLFILFKVGNNDNRWNTLAQRLRVKPEYVLEYLCGVQNGKNLLMMVFQVPEKFTREYLLFKEGKYSKFGDDYKKLFLRYTYNDKAQPVESIIWRVLYKSEELRKELIRYFGDDVEFDPEDELWGIPEPKYEIYRYE
jgi:hypothetical protein